MVNMIIESNKSYFNNCFSLNFANRQIDKIFHSQNNNVYTKKAFIMSCLTLCIELGINLWIHFYIWNILKSDDISKYSKEEIIANLEKAEKISCLFILTYTNVGLTVINLIVGLISFKIRELINFAHFFNFLCIGLVFINLREILFVYFEKSYSIYFSLEILIKFLFLLLVECNYKIITIASTLCIIVIWTVGTYTGMPTIEIVSSNAILVILPIFSYFVEKSLKLLFYYKWKISTKNEWLKSTLDNFQNGLLVLDRTKMHYFNEYVSKKLQFLLEKNASNQKSKMSTSTRQIKSSNYEHHPRYLSQAKSLNLKSKVEVPIHPKMTNNFLYYGTCNDNTFNNNNSVINVKSTTKNYEEYYLNKFLFHNLENLNPELSCEVIENLQNKNLLLQDILDTFDKDNKINNTFTEFQFIGIKRFQDEIENEELTILEIYVRIVEKEDNKIAFEFIFNDVTRCKVLEEAKAQIKYKTLFLAKVAHEFKNPLIIIKELVDQILDDENLNKNCENTFNNLTLSKNLCSYMLILVKDFEVISKKENSTKIELSQSFFNIREEIQQLNQIVITLIAKKFESAMNAPIKFILEIPTNIPDELYTDKNRIIQILINLLSNSIKFTHNGTIELKLELIENEDKKKINFKVLDTGTGISESQVKNLFKHFYKSNDVNNSYGSGLGLSIVKELCNVLGSKIMFNHNEPNGCIFSFEIDVIERVTPISLDNSLYEAKINELSSKIENLNIIAKKEPLLKRRNTSFNLQYALNEIHNARISKKQKSILKKINTTFNDFSFNNSIFTSFGKKQSRNSVNYTAIDTKKLLKVQLEEPIIDPHIEDSMNNYIENSPQSMTQSSAGTPKMIIPGNTNTNTNYKSTQFSSLMIFQTPFINHSPSSFNLLDFKISSFYLSQIDDSNSYFPKCNSNIKKINKAYKRCRKKKNKNETFGKLKSRDSSKEFLENKNPEPRKLALIIADDDSFIRKSILRQLDHYFTSLKIDLDLTVFEVTDGIECLYTVYNAILQSIFIDLIITDETMKYMPGSLFSELLSRLSENNILPYKIPVSIVTSYEDNINSEKKYSCVCGLYTKPVNPDILEKIFKNANIHF